MANKRVAVSGSRHALRLGFRDPRQIQPPVLARARLDHRLHGRHVLLGTVLGLVVGILRLRRWPVIDWLLLAYIELFRCTPLLVQIIWFYYAFPVVIGVNIPAHVAAVTVLSLYGGAFYAEIVRGSIESVNRGQWDAARGLGLGP